MSTNDAVTDPHAISAQRTIPGLTRAALAPLIGCALAGAWLQPTYEMFVGAVYQPKWLDCLQFGSLAILGIVCVYLIKRDRRLCIIAWCAFWLSLIANVMPGYVG